MHIVHLPPSSLSPERQLLNSPRPFAPNAASSIDSCAARFPNSYFLLRQDLSRRRFLSPTHSSLPVDLRTLASSIYHFCCLPRFRASFFCPLSTPLHLHSSSHPFRSASLSPTAFPHAASKRSEPPSEAATL